LLATLWSGGWLRAVDHALALSLRRAHPETPDWLQAAAALGSRALAHGHGRLPLSRVDELFAEVDAEREPPALPALEDWLALLRASPWVHVAGAAPDTTPVPADRLLVLQGDALSLRRYWQYEARLAQALRARLEHGGAGGRLRVVSGGPGTG
jgi:exodeoxyribonuclease V alpha subunit